MPSPSKTAVGTQLGEGKSAELAGWQRYPYHGSIRPLSDWWPVHCQPEVGGDTPILLCTLVPLSSWGSHKRAKGLERRRQERKEL